MPFILHKDALTEETAASDYQKWLYDDADANAEQASEESGSSRNELMQVPQQENRRFETCG